MKKHQVLNMIKKVYSQSPDDSWGGRVLRSIQDYNYPNGMPLNILKAVTLIDCLGQLVDLGHCSKSVYESVLNDCVTMSGYSREELLERVAI